MIYGISIDWLALFCKTNVGGFRPARKADGTILGALPYRYKLAEYGTRQFCKLYEVWLKEDKIAEVQAEPRSEILGGANVCIVRFANRILYRGDLWDIVQHFLGDHKIEVQNISRLDLCADFNTFATYHPVQFIADFLSSKIRHKGRGQGQAHFNHYSTKNGAETIAHIDYTGLTFGSHSSDAHVYLYNKSFELKTQKDKPYIRDFWRLVGLDLQRDVWRLEISLKSKAMTFVDKAEGEKILIDANRIADAPELVKIYHTFVKKLFSFVKNDHHITNISREPLLILFDTTPIYQHGVLRNITGGGRTERILIKQLWQMAGTYRGEIDGNIEKDSKMKAIAEELARVTDLDRWLMNKKYTWEQPNKKQ